MGYRQKKSSEPQSGIWLDSTLFPQKPQPVQKTPPATVRNISAEQETIIIPGTPVETKEKITGFFEKSKQEYAQSWQDIKNIASRLKKRKEPVPAPQIQPFLAHSPPPNPVPVAEQPRPVPQSMPSYGIETQSVSPPRDEVPIVSETQKRTVSAVPLVSSGGIPAWRRVDRKRTIGTRQINPEFLSGFGTDEDSDTGRIISAIFEEQKPAVITIISSLFFLITFIFTTLTLFSFGLILALAITLNNAGTPGFLYLRYYPNIGLLPIITCAAAIVFMYIGYKIRDASRFGWTAGMLSLAVIPIAFSLVMPVMSYPLVRLVSIYAGTARQAFQPPVIDLTMLSRFFSILLVFEGVLVLLIASARHFRFPDQPLPQNARSSMIMMIFLFLVPISTVMAYGYIDSQDTDMGYAVAQSRVGYRLYVPEIVAGNRTFATRYITDEELAGLYNAVRVTFDVPLPTLLKTGKNSQIILKEVQVGNDFSLESYLSDHTAPGSKTETIPLSESLNGSAFLVQDDTRASLWTMFPENILIMASTKTATPEELTEFVASLR